jgi:methylenetetrahydrofolate dehydrogenase (NADP+) / methenyltetrahydrofolate cyclohydrolase
MSAEQRMDRLSADESTDKYTDKYTDKIIDGKKVAAQVRTEVAEGVRALHAERGITPGLAAVIVGDDPASHTYVRMKRKACAEVGIASFGFELPATTTQQELEALIADLNARADVHGILVQLPLPAHLNTERILDAVSLQKDVDGFSPHNLGAIAAKGREPRFVPATPAGIMRLLDAYNVPLSGANAVVLGRSNIVGMPVALLLTRRDATVTICHSRTKDLPDVVRRADVLIAAIGRVHMVKADWIKPGAVVIDVGTNRVDIPSTDPAAPNTSRLVGDVDYEAALAVAGMITPVPGGVGPMTIAMLLSNTLHAAASAAKE